MPTLSMAFDIAARDSASPVFAKVGTEAAKTAKSVEQAAAAMQKAANAEVDAAAKVRVAQARLDDVRKSGKASAGKLAAAEEQLALAERHQVRAQGDAVRAAGEHERALKKLGAETSRASRAGEVFGRSVSGGIKGTAVLGVAAIASAVALLREGLDAGIDLAKSSIAEARESQQVGAKTTAIIKATGGAAKISADQIGALSTAISNKTGIDDEAIQSGSNLLLTFRNVRNEAGKGGDIFNRATAAAVDLSKAGFGSITGASKQLGKALNDPVKGISALNKAGVTFSDSQKEQIKAMVKSGNVLGAQKIILGEVEHQVKGVAAASATAGEKLKVAWDNGKESLGTGLLPALDSAEKLILRFGGIGKGALKPFIQSITGGKGAASSLVGFLDTHQADITQFFVSTGHAAITFGKIVAVVVEGALRAYVGLQKGIQASLEFILSSTQDAVGVAAAAANALGLDKQAGMLLKVNDQLQKMRDNNKASDSGAGLAESIADGIKGKLLPALTAADAGLKKVGNAEIGKARLRDAAASAALAIKGIGTQANGSQLHLKKFSDVSKLSATQQNALKGRIHDAQKALQDQVKAAQDAGEGQKKLTKTWQTGKDRLYDEFKQMGLSNKEAKKLADRYAGIKPKVTTRITQPGMSGALDDTQKLTRYITNIHGKNVKITYSSNAAQFAKSFKLGLSLNSGERGSTGTTARGGLAGHQNAGMAHGGILPGFTPVHQGDDVSIPLAEGGIQRMRRGEGVYVSEAMKDPYERSRLFAVNKAALRGESLSRFRETDGLATGGVVKISTPVNTAGLGMPDFGTLGTRIAVSLGNKLGALIGGGLDKAAAAAAGGPIGGGSYAGALKWAKSQVGKPYIFGAAGPRGYDCSGFMAAIQNFIEGKALYHRRYSTPAFHGAKAGGFTRGKRSPFMVGVNPAPGKSGHMAGTLNGVNVESAGGVGVRVGGRARGYNAGMFSWRGGLAHGGLVGDLPFDLIDPRGERYNPRLRKAVRDQGLFDQGGLAHGAGWMPKKTIRPERVLSPQQTVAFDKLVTLLERQGANSSSRGPLVHVERVDSGVDLDLFAQRAEFRDRQGSFN